MRLAMVLGLVVAVSCSMGASTDAIIIGQGEVVHDGSIENPEASIVGTTEATAEHVSSFVSVYNISLLGLTPVALWLLLRRRWLALPPTGASDDLMPVLLGFGAFAALFVAQIVGSGIAATLVGVTGEGGEISIPQDDLRVQALLRMGGYALAGPVLVVYLMAAGRMDPEPDDPDRDGSKASVLWRVVIGLAALGLFWPLVNTTGVGAAALARLITGEPPDAVSHSTLRLLLDPAQGVWRWITIGSVVLLAPLVEEIGYRGMAQGALRQLTGHPWLAIGVTSVLFVFMHITALQSSDGSIQWNGLASLFVISVGFGWLRERSRSLLAPIVMHAGFNCANVALALLQSA